MQYFRLFYRFLAALTTLSSFQSIWLYANSQGNSYELLQTIDEARSIQDIYGENFMINSQSVKFKSSPICPYTEIELDAFYLHFKFSLKNPELQIDPTKSKLNAQAIFYGPTDSPLPPLIHQVTHLDVTDSSFVLLFLKGHHLYQNLENIGDIPKKLRAMTLHFSLSKPESKSFHWCTHVMFKVAPNTDAASPLPDSLSMAARSMPEELPPHLFSFTVFPHTLVLPKGAQVGLWRDNKKHPVQEHPIQLNSNIVVIKSIITPYDILPSTPQKYPERGDQNGELEGFDYEGIPLHCIPYLEQQDKEDFLPPTDNCECTKEQEIEQQCPEKECESCTSSPQLCDSSNCPATPFDPKQCPPQNGEACICASKECDASQCPRQECPSNEFDASQCPRQECPSNEFDASQCPRQECPSKKCDASQCPQQQFEPCVCPPQPCDSSNCPITPFDPKQCLALPYDASNCAITPSDTSNSSPQQCKDCICPPQECEACICPSQSCDTSNYSFKHTDVSQPTLCTPTPCDPSDCPSPVCPYSPQKCNISGSPVQALDCSKCAECPLKKHDIQAYISFDHSSTSRCSGFTSRSCIYSKNSTHENMQNTLRPCQSNRFEETSCIFPEMKGHIANVVDEKKGMSNTVTQTALGLIEMPISKWTITIAMIITCFFVF